jgi:hypothetical protein
MVLETLQMDVIDLRYQMEELGLWYYGCNDRDMIWPYEALSKAPLEDGNFGQPMCDRCRTRALDYSTVWADFHYIVNERASCPEGKRDYGNENMTIQDFHALPEAQEAKLTIEETIAVRFYSSNSYAAINNALRDESREDAHPFPAIATCIANGVKKLQAVGAAKKEAKEQRILWRGYKDVDVTRNFSEEGGTGICWARVWQTRRFQTELRNASFNR